MDIDKTADNKRTRRFAVAPGQLITARYVRVVTTGGSGLGIITIASIAIHEETAFTGAVRTFNFNFRKGQEYTLALTPGHADVFYNGVWQAAFGHALTAAMLAEMDNAQKLDSFLAFHEELETPLVKRQGRHTEWDFAPFPFENLPLYDFGGAYVNGVNAVQRKAGCCDTEQTVRLAVARRTNGADRLWLERIDRSCVTEAAHVAAGSGITSIAIPAAFNGETCHVFCDKAYLGTRVVTAGAIAGLPACDRIEAGFAVLADVVDMPVLKDEDAGRPMARQKRVSTLHLSLFETDHVAVQVNGGEIHEVPLMTLGEAEIGESIGDRPFTGTVHLEGFLGFTEQAQVRILQLRPGRLTVRQIRKEVRV
jgi:hypothetical protein